jgi:hypothetical protein
MFSPKPLDKILARFNQTIADLIELTDHHDKNIAEKSDHICDLESEIKEHSIERDKAHIIRNNLETLVMGDAQLK